MSPVCQSHWSMDIGAAVRSREALSCAWCGLTVPWNCPREFTDHEAACCAIELWQGRRDRLEAELRSKVPQAEAERDLKRRR